MDGQTSAILNRASWLRRTLTVHLPDGEHQLEYSSRNLVQERIVVNGRVEIQTRISSWFRPIFRFFIGSQPAVVEVRVAPWLTLRSFHLLVGGRVLYCDHRRDLFEGQEPRRGGADKGGMPVSPLCLSGDPLCPFCDRELRGVAPRLDALPDEFVQANEPLGRPTAVFSFGRRQRLAWIAAGILATVLGIALVALLWLLPIQNAGADMNGRHSGQLLGLLLAGVGPVLVLYARKYRLLHAVTSSEGVALIENDTVSWCRWQNIETVWETLLAGETSSTLQASARGENHMFRVRCRAGKELVFRSFLDDLPWLGQIIKHETLPYLLPPAVAALKAGEALSFGPLSLDSEGLSAGADKFLSWAELKDVQAANGLLVASRIGKRWAWLKVPLGQVPNAHVLLVLVSCYRKEFPAVDDSREED